MLDKLSSSRNPEAVMEARAGIIEILKFLPSPEHAENIVWRYPAAAEAASFEELNELAKDG